MKIVRLSRNFGEHAAVTAGLEKTTGEWVVVLDCDLQDAPEDIPELYAKAVEGYDLVLSRRSDRGQSLGRKLASRAYHRLLNVVLGTKLDAERGRPVWLGFGEKSVRKLDPLGRKPEWPPGMSDRPASRCTSVSLPAPLTAGRSSIASSVQASVKLARSHRVERRSIAITAPAPSTTRGGSTDSVSSGPATQSSALSSLSDAQYRPAGDQRVASKPSRETSSRYSAPSATRPPAPSARTVVNPRSRAPRPAGRTARPRPSSRLRSGRGGRAGHR